MNKNYYFFIISIIVMLLLTSVVIATDSDKDALAETDCGVPVCSGSDIPTFTGNIDSHGCKIYQCASTEKRKVGLPCWSGSDCESNYCLFNPPSVETGICACINDDDCSKEKTCPDGSTYHEIGCKNNVCEQILFPGGSPCGRIAIQCITDNDCSQCVEFKLNQIACINGECMDIYDCVPICNKKNATPLA